MAIIKNKYKDRVDQAIKTFPNGTIPADFTRRIIYDNETNLNPNIIRTPKYGDDLDTTEFSKVIADLVYNDTIINEESEKHNYIYSNGVIKNYHKEFEIYEKNLLQVLFSYDVNNIIDRDTFSLTIGNSIAGNFTVPNNYCNFYFYTNSQRLLNLYDFFYKEFTILNIETENNSTPTNFKDDYSIIIFNGEIPIQNDDLQSGETIGIVLYLPINTVNTTPYKPKNYINYIKIGDGALKIGDTFVDIKKDTYVSRSIINDQNLNQIKIPDIIENKFLDSYRTRRDMLIAYYDQNSISNNVVFEGIVDLIVGDERINMYSALDTQLAAIPRIKKIEYLTLDNESFHRIYLDDLCLLKGINSRGQEIFFRKNNQIFSIRNSINNTFDGEYLIKNIDYENRTLDFIHPTFNNSSYYQPEETENMIGYYGYIVPNIYVLYSLLVYKDNGYNSESQIMKAEPVFDYIGLESGVIRIEKTVLEKNSDGLFEISKNEIKHLKNFNGNLLEYDDAQSLDVPSKTATSFTLNEKINGDYLLRPSEQQLPNEYDEIGLNSLTNSHFIITEDNFNVINNSKISLSEINIGIKNSLDSIGTEGIKIKLEEVTMLYPINDLRKIESIEAISLGNEYRITLSTPDPNIEVDDILFISKNQYLTNEQLFNGNGDYQTIKIKRIENEKLIVDKITSTYTAEFKRNVRYPIFFNIIKKNSMVKICESLLINTEIYNQVINGLNGKFGDKNSFSKLKFDRFIENIVPNSDLLANGISVNDAKDFKLDVNKYYFISVAGFVINNIVGSYSSILIEDHNLADDLHFKKSIYYEINIKSFKGRYPNSLIISDEFGDINVFDITRSFAPFFRAPKYSIMAYDFSNIDVSIRDIPPDETVVLFDPLSGRFKFHPNATPSRIYLSYYSTENLSGAAEAENFVYKRGKDSNDTLRGKIQDLDNKYVYGANFNSPIVVNGIINNNNLNYKGPFKIKNNLIELKNNYNFVDLDINKFDIEIDKNISYEIIDIEKEKIYLQTDIVDKNNEIQSINRSFLDQLRDQEDKNYYEPPALNDSEEIVFNVSEDTTIDFNLINIKKWHKQINPENAVSIPFLTNKKFNKINFYNFDKKIIIECTERTKTENLISEKTNLNDILSDFVYRKLKEKNYRYALKNDYTEDKTVSFKQNDEIKELNKTLAKDSKHFNKSEIVNAFIESENNLLMKREEFVYSDLNINKTNSDNYIIIDEHIVNFDIKIINKKYDEEIIFANSSLTYNQSLPNAQSILSSTLYFFETAGYNQYLEKEIEIGDFIIKNEEPVYDATGWDFYKKNDIFNISKLTKNDDLNYALSDFNDINIDYRIADFSYSLQEKLLNNILVRNDIVKVNENIFLIFLLIKDTNDTYSLYLQKFEADENKFFYPKKIDGDFQYIKIASSQITGDLLKINKNNIFYDFMIINENTFVICIMSDSFLFKYFYLNDLTLDEGLTFINDKQIKNNPKLFKLNEQVFGIFFNSENTLNYDSSLGDLELKLFDIQKRNNIIFSYQETEINYSRVDKIIFDNIKNGSPFNYLRMNDDTIIIFYSNINTFYLKNLAFINGEYITDYPSGLLNSFKVIHFKKNELDYIFDVSNKKMVYYQNIGQTTFPPKIYPFKINDNIFGVNYIQYNLNNVETGNRMYTYNIDGVLQKVIFENDEYTEANPDSIKYIYSLNNRQAIEFSDNVKIHNFNNDYTQLILKETVDYKKYFPSYNYDNLFSQKTKNGFEIKTITDKDGNVFNKKILTYFSKENNIYKLNVALINDLEINFSTVTKFDVTFNPVTFLEENEKIIYQTEILYFENKIFLVYMFLAYDNSLNKYLLITSLLQISDKLENESANFQFLNNIININYLKVDEDYKNRFFFNKVNFNSIEIYCLRKFNIDLVDKNVISKFTLEITDENGNCEFLETRLEQNGDINLNDSNVDLIYDIENIDIINIIKINKNNKIKYILESYKFINNIDNYDYFYVQDDLQFFNLFSLTINKFNINHINYSENDNELVLFGDINANIVNYVFDFNVNLFESKVLDQYTENYNFSKLDFLESSTFFYYKVINETLFIKFYLKKKDEEILLAYQNSYVYDDDVNNIIFNNYKNIYETFIYLGSSFIRDIWNFFPMNDINSGQITLQHEIFNNKLNVNETYKNIFSGLSISATVSYNQAIDKDIITIFDEKIIKIINKNVLNDLTFYINNSGDLCVFKIVDKVPDTNYYEILYFVGENNNQTILNKRLDYILYINETYSFYKKSYQSLTLKLNMFNYKGEKKNQYEIYRKNNYYYLPNTVFDYNTLYRSDVFIIKGDYKDLQVIYHIDDEYEKTKIYAQKYIILNNNLYTFENKHEILIDEYEEDDKITFICEKLGNSNIFFNFKKNNDYIYNFILNKNYGLEEIDPDFTKRELYKFININKKTIIDNQLVDVNVLQDINNYHIEPFIAKKLFNDYLLLLLKIKKDNVTKIAHVLYRENGSTIEYYNNNYDLSYELKLENVIGYSKPTVNSYGYTSLFLYKDDYSKDILQFGIDGEGGICKLKGITNLF